MSQPVDTGTAGHGSVFTTRHRLGGLWSDPQQANVTVNIRRTRPRALCRKFCFTYRTAPNMTNVSRRGRAAPMTGLCIPSQTSSSAADHECNERAVSRTESGG